MGATPALLGAALAVGAIAALALTLIASVRRRRRDLALLKALGFTRRQLAGTVAWQSTIAVGVGVVIGVPLGIVAGRELWDLFAHELHVVPQAERPRVDALLRGHRRARARERDRRAPGISSRENADGTPAARGVMLRALPDRIGQRDSLACRIRSARTPITWQRERRVLLHEEHELALVDARELRLDPRDRARTPRARVDQRQLTDDAAGLHRLDHDVAYDDVDRPVDDRVHDVARLTLL